MGKRGYAPSAVIAERDKRICEKYESGRTTLERLAQEHDLTRERIRQILLRCGVDYRNPKGPRLRAIQGIHPDQGEAWDAKIQEIRAKYRAKIPPQALQDEYGMAYEKLRDLLLGRGPFARGGPGALTSGEFRAIQQAVRALSPNARALLTFEQVRSLRERVARKEITVAQAGRESGLKGPAIIHALSGRTYKGAGGPLYVPTHTTHTLGPEGAKTARERFATGKITKAALAKDLKVCSLTISHALSGKIYPNAGGPIAPPQKKGRKAKLSPEQRQAILDRKRKGDKVQAIALDLGCSEACVYRALRRADPHAP